MVRISSAVAVAYARTVARPAFIWCMASQQPRRILAVASSGGHWVQLRRLRPAFADHDVAYLTTHAGHRDEVGSARFYVVRDANRWSKLSLIGSALRIAGVLLRERPDIVVSTGAAPGYIAVRLAKLMGARTAWIDSVANVEELSLSGQMASRQTDLCLTQWSHLAGGPVSYEGAVL
jgi:UDP-N-acetylglucosamine:LPS N-acetylglucosamine transferase